MTIRFDSRLLLDSEFLKTLFQREDARCNEILDDLKKINASSAYGTSNENDERGQNLILESEIKRLSAYPTILARGIGCSPLRDSGTLWAANQDASEGRIYGNLTIVHHLAPFEPYRCHILTKDKDGYLAHRLYRDSNLREGLRILDFDDSIVLIEYYAWKIKHMNR